MFTVTALARQANVTPDTIRHYVHIGLLSPEKNPHNGYKYFNHTDTDRVRFVRKAKRLGFSLADISNILVVAMSGGSPCPQVREIMQRRIEENRVELEALNRLQNRMERALRQWQCIPDQVSANGIVCSLIESLVPSSIE